MIISFSENCSGRHIGYFRHYKVEDLRRKRSTATDLPTKNGICTDRADRPHCQKYRRTAGASQSSGRPPVFVLSDRFSEDPLAGHIGGHDRNVLQCEGVGLERIGSQHDEIGQIPRGDTAFDVLLEA